MSIRSNDLVQDLEESFDIGCYDICERLEVWQWSNVLGVRWAFTTAYREDMPTGEALEEYRAITRSILERGINERIIEAKPYIWSGKGVHIACVRESCVSDLMARAKTLYELLPCDQSEKVSEEAEKMVAEILRIQYSALLEVDLESTDEQIKDAFLLWLASRRKQMKQPPTFKNFSSKVLRSWCKHRVLACIDLDLYAAYHRVELPNHFVGRLLFPDEFEVDTGERVRKVVRPLAREILSDRNIAALGRAGEHAFYGRLENNS